LISFCEQSFYEITANGKGISAGGAKKTETLYKHRTEQKNFFRF